MEQQTKFYYPVNNKGCGDDVVEQTLHDLVNAVSANDAPEEVHINVNVFGYHKKLRMVN